MIYFSITHTNTHTHTHSCTITFKTTGTHTHTLHNHMLIHTSTSQLSSQSHTQMLAQLNSQPYSQPHTISHENFTIKFTNTLTQLHHTQIPSRTHVKNHPHMCESHIYISLYTITNLIKTSRFQEVKTPNYTRKSGRVARRATLIIDNTSSFSRYGSKNFAPGQITNIKPPLVDHTSRRR